MGVRIRLDECFDRVGTWTNYCDSAFSFFFFNLYYLFFILIFLETYLIRVWQVLSIFNEQSSELIFLASLIKFKKKKSGLVMLLKLYKKSCHMAFI